MNVTFQEAYDQAVKAANQAGDEFMKMYPDYRDCCGFAHINFEDKRSKTYKQAKAANLAYNEMLMFDYYYQGMQELTLKEVCMNAAVAKFEELGFKGLRMRSWMD